MLCLHFIPNGIRTFHAGFNLVIQSYFVEFCTDRSGEIVEKRVALCLCRGYFRLYRLVSIGMFVAEAKVFEFGFYFIEPQTIG